jgi:uncharacterized protein
MEQEPFDPFNDRLARDLRNALSEALAADLPSRRLERSLEVAAAFRVRPLPARHRRYLEQRLAAYQRALAAIRDRRLDHPFHQALVLWDEGLFFEVHEILEPLWYRAPPGPTKNALQGLIRAAGAYIHLAVGRRDSASAIAAKAIRGLAYWDRSELPPFPDLPRLQAALAELAVPPSLAASLPANPELDRAAPA